MAESKTDICCSRSQASIINAAGELSDDKASAETGNPDKTERLGFRLGNHRLAYASLTTLSWH